ncbi:MAG: Zn-ribbon domain-containing OB-fold protein [Desulfurococcaceae archaeon]|nr:Zn-ribbon domain-containing OB-fold protein [Desulfurococcaceae archaeon]
MTTIQRVWRLKNTLLNLLASRCSVCGHVTYPPKMRCPVCGSRELREESLPREGEVLSYTIIRVPAKGFEDFTPLIIALIKLGDAKVLAEVVDVKPEEVSVGMRVVATVRRTAQTIDGGVPYVIKFKPLRS